MNTPITPPRTPPPRVSLTMLDDTFKLSQFEMLRVETDTDEATTDTDSMTFSSNTPGTTQTIKPRDMKPIPQQPVSLLDLLGDIGDITTPPLATTNDFDVAPLKPTVLPVEQVRVTSPITFDPNEILEKSTRDRALVIPLKVLEIDNTNQIGCCIRKSRYIVQGYSTRTICTSRGNTSENI